MDASGIVVFSVKSVMSTFVTDSENVTVKSTLAASVGSSEARTIELTVGAVVSTVHVWEAGEASTLFDGSIARTSKVCEPSAKSV